MGLRTASHRCSTEASGPRLGVKCRDPSVPHFLSLDVYSKGAILVTWRLPISFQPRPSGTWDAKSTHPFSSCCSEVRKPEKFLRNYATIDVQDTRALVKLVSRGALLRLPQRSRNTKGISPKSDPTWQLAYCDEHISAPWRSQANENVFLRRASRQRSLESTVPDFKRTGNHVRTT